MLLLQNKQILSRSASELKQECIHVVSFKGRQHLIHNKDQTCKKE